MPAYQSTRGMALVSAMYQVYFALTKRLGKRFCTHHRSPRTSQKRVIDEFPTSDRRILDEKQTRNNADKVKIVAYATAVRLRLARECGTYWGEPPGIVAGWMTGRKDRGG